MKTRNLILACCSLALVGCLPEFDFDKFNNLEYRGEWEMPLVSASVSLEDVLAEDTLFTTDPDGGIRLIYESDSVFGIGIEEFAKVPAQSPLGTTVPLDIPSISVSTSLGTVSGAKFKNIELRDGNLHMEVTNGLSATVELRVRINNATLNSNVFEVDITATPGVTNAIVPVGGLTLDLTNGGVTENYLSFEIFVLNNGGAAPGETVDLSLTYEDLHFGSALGYFGQRVINLPSGNLQLGVEAFENFLNGLYLDNPTIELIVSSNVGLPLQLGLDLDGVSSQGNTESLGLGDIDITGPSTPGNYDTTRVIIDKNTSNIVDFIANVPSQLLYSGTGIMNPQGETGTDNYISADGLMQVGMKLDLPLELRTDNLIFEQVINNLDFSDLREQGNPIESLDLIFNVENEFPFEADLKVRFLASNGFALDSASLNLFDAAPVDANGRSTGYRITTEEETFTQQKIDNLLNSSSMEIIITMNTTNGGTTTVKLYSDYDIKVAIGMRAKLNYDI